MASALKDIRAALATQLLTLQSGGSPPIAFEGENYEPTQGTLYLQERFIPADRGPVGMENASTDEYVGIYQITVACEGGKIRERFAAETQAAAIEDAFPRGSEYTVNSKTVKIMSTRTLPGGAALDKGWYEMPVEIHWLALE